MADRNDTIGRRSFLTRALAGAAGLAVATRARDAHASPFLAMPTGIWGPSFTPYKVLEVFLAGGVSQWESFWVNEGQCPGGAAREWRGLCSQVRDLEWGCTPMPSSPDETQLVGADAAGRNVSLGPSTKPLWQWIDKLRLVAVSHGFAPHEVGVPYQLCGFRPGNPRLAGAGAAIQAEYRTREPQRTLPVSYTFSPSTATTAVLAAQSAGLLGASRPLLVKVGSADFNTAAARASVLPAENDLDRALAAQFGRLVVRNSRRQRSEAYDAYSAASAALAKLPEVSTRLPPLASPESPACASGSTAGRVNHVAKGIEAAAKLLRDGTARYACVVDSGFAGTYDSHGSVLNGVPHAELVSSNVFNVCAAIREQVTQGNLCLSDTIIVVNTDFGRTTAVNNGGRDHHPGGFAQLLLGGPVTRGVSGTIAANGFAVAGESYNAPDVRTAILLASGINPLSRSLFSQEAYSQAVRSGAYTDEAVLRNVRRDVLGVAANDHSGASAC